MAYPFYKRISTQLAYKIFDSVEVIIFGGEFGKGKSLSLTGLACELCRRTGRIDILSNMPLKYKSQPQIKITPLLCTHHFDLGELESIQRYIIVWDEIFNDIQSRSPMSEKNKYISQMGAGFRKDKIKLLGSLQFFDTLDVMVHNLVAVQIIPEFVKTYSKDKNLDTKLRLKNKDFRIYWNCKNKLTGEQFTLVVNLYEYINCYNTRFKPYKLLIDHKEFLDNIELKSHKKFETYREKLEQERKINTKNWNEGYNEIGSFTI